jgi:hypothetical protein
LLILGSGFPTSITLVEKFQGDKIIIFKGHYGSLSRSFLGKPHTIKWISKAGIKTSLVRNSRFATENASGVLRQL